MKKLELYYFDECPYCQIVLQALAETGLKDKVSYKNTRQDPKNREFLMQSTGRGTVPVLYVDGVPMRESRDIANWLHAHANELR